MSRRRVLLTGSTGYLGAYLLRELRRSDHAVEVVTVGRAGGGCDLAVDLARAADRTALARWVAQQRPYGVLNAAALSTIGACERDPALAQATNALAAEALAHAVVAADRPVGMVQVSTDLVFDGRAAPYGADAQPRPLSEYGRSKVDAERRALAAGARVTVVRVPLLFGPSRDGTRGATDMVRDAGRNGRTVTLYTNEVRTPLHVEDAARGLVATLLALCTELAEERRASAVAPRVVHLAGDERLSRYELGRRFAAVAGIPVDVVVAAECDDPLRPRDVSLRSDWRPGRGLDDALRAS